MRIRISALVVIMLHTDYAYQAITGVISGTISDATGAVVPGVSVVATNQDTGVKQTVVTDSKGFYTFPVLDVGNYTVNTSISGFQSYVQKNIRVDANASVRTDISLQIGNQTQFVEVTSGTVQIETQSTQLGEVIESVKITGVPLNGRAFTDLLALQPGVSPYSGSTEPAALGGGSASGSLNAGNVSINGGREASNGFMVNGADVNDGVENGTAIVPNLDSISEFRIITNNFDAEYGNFSGGQVNVVTMNGTNRFHGSAFEFFRNTALNATGYQFTPAFKPAFNQNIFGGTFGGPIKRDKVFFFGDYQGTRQTIGVAQSFQTVSTQDLTGNLSDAANGYGSPSKSTFTKAVNGTGWANVLSNRLGYTVTPGEPYYAAGCVSNAACVFPNAVIPKSAWDPVIVAGMPKYIQPANATLSQAGQSLPYYSNSSQSNTLNDDKESGRVDVNTRLGTIFGYYFMDNYRSVNPYGGGSNGGFPTALTGRAQLANLGLTTTFKNNSVNTLRISYMRSTWHSNQPQYATGSGPSLASQGFLTPWGSTGGISPIVPSLEGVPGVTIAEGGGFGTPGAQDFHYDNTYQVSDSYMKVIGTHTLQWGGSIHYDQIDERNILSENGAFTFNDGNETGLGFADFLIGAPSGFKQYSIQVLDNRGYYLGAFMEDSWRASTNLTLNYGLRYEITTPWWDKDNKIEALVPGQQSVVFPNAPVGLVFPGDAGIPRTLAPIKYNKFAPRFGFDYSPSPKSGSFLSKLLGSAGTSSVRGGAGLFYTSFQEESGYEEAGDPPYGNDYNASIQTMLHAPYIDRATQIIEAPKFPFNWPPTNVSPSNPYTGFNFANVEPMAGNWFVRTTDTVPRVVMYFLGLQRSVGRNSVLTFNYVGSEGRHLANAEEANPGLPSLCLALDTAAKVQAGSTPCGPNGENIVYHPAGGGTQAGTRPIFGNAFGSNPYSETRATSNYNSLQVNFKHTSKSWDVLAGYTWSKSLDNSSGLTDYVNPYFPKQMYGLSKFNVSQYLVASFNLHLPFADWSSNRVVKSVVGGWSISGISKFATGLPVNLTDAEDYSLTGSSGVDSPYYKPGNLFAGGTSGDRNPRNRNVYFNTSLFTKESAQCGTTPALQVNCYGLYGNAKRRFFSGPGLDQTDLAVLRDFHIHEKHVVQVRFEAFNFLNHTQFAAPAANAASSSSFGLVQGILPNSQRVMQVAIKYHF